MTRARVLAALGGLVAWAVYCDGWEAVVHNGVAHPMMALQIPGGERLHEATDPRWGRGLRYRRRNVPTRG